MSVQLAWLVLAATLPGPSPTDHPSLADTFERVNSSVVTIRAEETAGSSASEKADPSSMKVGSGVVISDEGRILTAAHVVELANKILVEFAGGEIRTAHVVASEAAADLAMLDLSGSLPPSASVAVLADSDHVRVGDQVAIIGAPLDMGHTLTVGYVSARRKEEWFLGGMRHVEHFQTDAAINMGNSGGPMFSRAGEVIGIVCHIMTRSGGSEGLGFAITSKAVRQILLDRRSVWIGFVSRPLPANLAQALNVPEGRTGLLVQRVAPGSPAEAMGLHGGSIPATIQSESLVLGGDIILEIQGITIRPDMRRESIAAALRAIQIGDDLRVKVFRTGRVLVLKTTVKR